MRLQEELLSPGINYCGKLEFWEIFGKALDLHSHVHADVIFLDREGETISEIWSNFHDSVLNTLPRADPR